MSILSPMLPTLIQRGLSIGDDPAVWAIDQLCRWLVWAEPPYEYSPGVLWTCPDGSPMYGAGGIPSHVMVAPRQRELRPRVYIRHGGTQCVAWEHPELNEDRERLRVELGVPPAWEGCVPEDAEARVLAELVRRGVGPGDAKVAIENRLQRCAVFWWSAVYHSGRRSREWDGLPGYYRGTESRTGRSIEPDYCRQEIRDKRVEFYHWDTCSVDRTDMWFTELRDSYCVWVPWPLIAAEGIAVPAERRLGET